MYNNSQYPSTIGYQVDYSQYASSGYPANYDNYQGYTGYQSQTPQQSVAAQGEPPTNNWSTSYQSDPKDAVAQEMEQQKIQLVNQRDDYVKKARLLKQELDQLQMQKQDLVGDGCSIDKDLAHIVKQNEKLQEGIQGKIKAIHNVIEMLSSIIKDNKSISDLENETLRPDKNKPSVSPISSVSQSVYNNSSVSDIPLDKNSESYSYVHYDTGMHWCRICDKFPETAKDFLLHLQEKEHKQVVKENDIDNTPWHKLPAEPLMPSDERLPQKRIPIKGLQFFISAPSWYCKLCDIWIGDLHCASHHLKSQNHHQNYENFITQNPHWEMEWLKDREKYKSRKNARDSSSSEDEKKKRKRSGHSSSNKEKKKKRKSRKKKKHSSDSSSSSSSSSSSDDNDDKSRSIRVAMRNMKQAQSIIDEDLSSKWDVLEKLVEEHKKKDKQMVLEKEKNEEAHSSDDRLINQWMTVSQPPEKEKIMFDSLKDRMKQKHEQEKLRLQQLDKLKRDRERDEAERLERKKQEDKEAIEREALRRELKEYEELEKIRDKSRNQVRFKPNPYRRKRRSYSQSDDEDNERSKYRGEREKESSRHHSRSKSRSKSVERKSEENNSKKLSGPPGYKKLPFIGRMPLFKNKPKVHQDEKEEPKEIKKESYEIPRRTRFEPGNLPKAFIPKPDVVCFPKLSSIPPLTIPPPPPVVSERVPIPEPPKISNLNQKSKDTGLLKAPPPPKLNLMETQEQNLSDDEILYSSEEINPSMMGQYYQHQSYQENLYHDQREAMHHMPQTPYSHSMPLQPPPLPPDDDLAMLGICADDMAAQTF